MGYGLDKIKKRNTQIYEIYTQVLIIVASLHASTRFKRGQNASLKSIREAVQLLLYCIEQDKRNIYFEKEDGLHEFAHKYRLPIFNNFSYNRWQRRLTLLLNILETTRSSRRYPYDETSIQRLYPRLSPGRRHALVRKDLERLKARFPQFGLILRRLHWVRSNFTFLMSKQTIPKNGTVCLSYRHTSGHFNLRIGYCQFSESITVCSGKPSFCARRNDQPLQADQKKEFDSDSLKQDQHLRGV
jgi:hypothetical protein